MALRATRSQLLLLCLGLGLWLAACGDGSEPAANDASGAPAQVAAPTTSVPAGDSMPADAAPTDVASPGPGSSGAAGDASGDGAGGAGTDVPPEAAGDDTPPVDVPDDTSQAPPLPSSGCGASDWPASGDFSIDVDGTQREYIVSIPDGYDPSTPHKLVFAWHGLGGTAAQIASGFRGGYYGLEPRSAGDTIFVAGQGLDTSNAVGSGPGWDNMGGRDVAFTAAMLEWLRGSYCVDDARIFSTGMSYGGIMSNTVGCALGEDFRAIAPMAGSGPGFGRFGADCVGQVAAWITHGNTDTVVAYSSGQASRDHWLEANHCAADTTAVGPENCVAYGGCDDGYPVHWCEFDGGHTVPGFASEAIWAFFSQF